MHDSCLYYNYRESEEDTPVGVVIVGVLGGIMVIIVIATIMIIIYSRYHVMVRRITCMYTHKDKTTLKNRESFCMYSVKFL